MLQELFKAITGATTTTAFSLPASNGISNVSPQATFSNFFNSLTSSLNPTGVFGGGLPQGIGTNPGAIQAYRNAQNQFAPQQIAELNNRALAPGAVIIDSPSGGTQPPVQQRGFGIMPNQLAALQPLQGNASQGGSFGNYGPVPFAQSGVPAGISGYGPGAGMGKLQLLLMPIIGLFGFVKSIFSMRGILTSLKPVKIDTQDTRYFNSQTAFNEFQSQEGSFDEYNPEVEDAGFNMDKLQEF